MDSFRRLILPVFFRIGVNVRRHVGRMLLVTLWVSYRSVAQSAMEPYLMLVNDNFLAKLISDRG
jgi:hypothetical protein